MGKNRLVPQLVLIVTLAVLVAGRVIEDQQNVTNPRNRVTREQLVLVGSSGSRNSSQLPLSLKQYSQYDENVELTSDINSNESILLSQDNEANYENNEVEQTSAELVEDAPNVDDTNPINQYCKCTTYECHCCRSFLLPVVPIRGPGCATIQYLEGNKMSVGIRFGNQLLASRVISGTKTTPICLPLPGGFSRFCARIYGITRRSNDFKACLGLELRADNEVEAALRVSCFNFGPKGLSVAEAEPLPPILPEENTDDDDDDDEDTISDLFSFGDDEDSEEETVGESDDTDDDDSPVGFSLLSGDFITDLFDIDSDSQTGSADQTSAEDQLNKNNEIDTNSAPEKVSSSEIEENSSENDSGESNADIEPDKSAESTENAESGATDEENADSNEETQESETQESEEDEEEEEEEEDDDSEEDDEKPIKRAPPKKVKKKVAKKPTGFLGTMQAYFMETAVNENGIDDLDDYDYDEAKKSKRKMAKNIEINKNTDKKQTSLLGRIVNFMS